MYTDPDRPHELIERYSFRFALARGRTDADGEEAAPTIDVFRNDTKLVTAHTKEEVRDLRMFPHCVL